MSEEIIMEPGTPVPEETTDKVENILNLQSVGIVRSLEDNSVIVGYNITEPNRELYIQVNSENETYNELIRKITPDVDGITEFEGVVQDPMLEE